MNDVGHHILLHYKHTPESDMATHHVVKSFVGFCKRELLHHTINTSEFRELNCILYYIVSILEFVLSLQDHVPLSRACPLGKL